MMKQSIRRNINISNILNTISKVKRSSVIQSFATLKLAIVDFHETDVQWLWNSGSEWMQNEIEFSWSCWERNRWQIFKGHMLWSALSGAFFCFVLWIALMAALRLHFLKHVLIYLETGLRICAIYLTFMVFLPGITNTIIFYTQSA